MDEFNNMKVVDLNYVRNLEKSAFGKEAKREGKKRKSKKDGTILEGHVGFKRGHLASKHLKSKLKHGPQRVHKPKQRQNKQEDQNKKPKKQMWFETRAGALKGAKFFTEAGKFLTILQNALLSSTKYS
ncbi:uncharacterized protein LOC123290809 [Chrysoperla carnea]|uniref:uncharacterized protein LOC123290809 n=1 Tax=Chrysoperla carnea TaxID=189513 RepID=UPI001D06CA23|nr:uncharacterized protein LOC123290809 [Chrysoperla carnea]